MKKLGWKILAIIDTIGLILIAPFGWKMAMGEPILQAVVILSYIILAAIIINITIYAFSNE